jgi:putative ABC transport system permease protein
MLAFYIFMVAQLVVENDRNEISVFKSRGASSMQIFNVYLIQSAILAIIAITIGPLLGIFICKVLGASNGFLELVSRSALPIKMTSDAILYSVIAGIFSIVVMMMPVVSASKISIVELKQKKARKWNVPLWQKMFLDVILLGISLYGLNSYQRQEEVRKIVSAVGEEVPLDPFTFVILTLFIFGAGLLLLRIYPYFIKFLYFIGRKIWSPVMYSTFIQVGRSSGREKFLMLFLVLTISIGIFSANSARTINQNTEDRVYYKNGCDVVLKAQWASNKKIDPFGLGIPGATASKEPIIYVEPPYNMISGMTDTVAAAKVFKPNDVSITVGGRCKRGVLMAITPDKFGEVVWKSNKLLPHHMNEYLNLLTYAPNAIIVSEDFRKEFGVKAGDSINYKWENNSLVEGVVVAFVKYWPSINPYVNKTNELFMIANLDYVQMMTQIEPYEVWFKAKDGAKTKNMYNYCLLYTSPSPRDRQKSRMPSSA